MGDQTNTSEANSLPRLPSGLIFGPSPASKSGSTIKVAPFLLQSTPKHQLKNWKFQVDQKLLPRRLLETFLALALRVDAPPFLYATPFVLSGN